MFGSGGRRGFVIRIIDWAPMFIESVFEGGFSFSYVLQLTAFTLNHVKKIFSVIVKMICF